MIDANYLEFILGAGVGAFGMYLMYKLANDMVHEMIEQLANRIEKVSEGLIHLNRKFDDHVGDHQ